MLASSYKIILAVVGLWFISASGQSSQLISLPEGELTCGPPWTPVVSRGTTVLFVPHSHSFSTFRLNLSCCHLCLRKLWNVSRDLTICLIPHRAWFSLGDKEIALQFCSFCAYAVAWARLRIQRYLCADTHAAEAAACPVPLPLKLIART